MKTNFKLFFTIFTITVFLLSFSSCNGNKTDNNEENTSDSTKHAQTHEVHWTYQGENGPEHWAEIVPNCNCGGLAQSPIDIGGDIIDVDLIELKTDYQTDSIDVINNGHTVQLNYQSGKFIFADEVYNLTQFHFHTASEHTLNGVQFPMEAHLVHLTTDNKIAVIGIWFKEGAENILLKKIIDKIPDQADETFKETLQIDIKNLFPVNKSYYHYVGSLTTPPCTEGVNWFVMKNPCEASKYQIEILKNSMPANNFRPVQDLNNRKIEDF
ncbi:MAG: carbonic anhydrase family protein [Bacteroidales bacterium]|nr:carbonic anhydrase family protein [Bacteroidales bacterium]MBN2756524.1 carbonic anhydrase family protein [Bacteroidales bacterium]